MQVNGRSDAGHPGDSIRGSGSILRACALLFSSLGTALLMTAAITMGVVTAMPDQQTPAAAPVDRITLRAARVFDGQGGVRTNAVIEIRGSKIVAIDDRTGPVTRDLGDVTLMPGMIDVHVHVDWHFQPNGLYGQREGQPRETAEQADAAIQANLDATLDAGVTTVQSLGAAQRQSSPRCN